MKTTISITKEMKQKLDEIGRKGETYNDILERLYRVAGKYQLEKLLLDDKNSVTIAEARKMINDG